MRKLTLVLFMAGFSQLAWTAGLNPAPGMGEAIGLSGAYTALADPDTACTFYYNPCGILNLDDPTDTKLRINLNTDFVIPQYNIRKSGFNRSKKSEAGSFYLLPLLGVSKQLNENVALGLGLYTPFGLGATYSRDLTKGFYRSETLLSLTNLSPTVAVRLSDKWSAGLSVNIGYGQFKYIAPFDIQGRPLPIPTDNQADGFGLGGSLSLRYRASDKLTWALTATSPTTITYRGGESQIQLGLLSIKDSFETEFTFPGKIGTGLAWQIHNKWTLATDFNYYFYNCAVNDMLLDFDKLPLIKRSQLDWQDVFSAHLGVRYQATDKLYLDAGIGYQPAAIPDETVSQLTPDVSGWSVSAGLGYQTKRVNISGYLGYAWGSRDVSWRLSHREPGHYYAGVYRLGLGLEF